MPGFKRMNHSIDLKALCRCLQFNVYLSCLMDQGLHQLKEYTERCSSGGFQDCMYTRILQVKITKKKPNIFPGKVDAKSSVPCWLCPAVAEAL